MLLGKRPRPPMRRTTSSSEFAASVLFDVEPPEPFAQDGIGSRHLESWQGAAEVAQRTAGNGADWRAARYMGSMLSPRGGVHRRNSGDFDAAARTAPFLRACGLCGRRLGPGRDAYMYRGEVAFCSLECRQQQMNLDEQREKCSPTSTKDTPSPTNGSEQSDNGGTATSA
ncbi:hypothetical protein B296_00019030 [Ensete ventricosum]|uniref:FLZ-type domain-containing protein n=1 Tax=Ensete ventricosum TaxID=4639 RepID=A0A426YZ35_ENSVE|nr:hypothetical protein B296_00019030 [Ensete ventricosum]